MNNNDYLKYGIGIDMAKAKFDACIGVINCQQSFTKLSSRQFANTPKGFVELIKWVKKQCKQPLPQLFVMEATGVYYENLAFHLNQQGEHVAVVLPNKAKKYKESLGLKSKNDSIDALGLSRMACEQALALWKAPQAGIYALRTLTRQIKNMATQITVASNQLEAVQYGMYTDKLVEKMLRQQIAFFKKQKALLLKSLEQAIAADPVLSAKFEKIHIKGLGRLAVATVVAETNGFELFHNSAQLVSYASYDVVENQSGSHRGKTKISKKGNSHIRHCLFFPALNMVRYRVSPFVQLYERIYERSRIKMKGYTAIQKKLLVMIYTLWKNDMAFDEQYHLKSIFADGEKAPSFGLENNPKAQKQVVPLKSRTTQDKHSPTGRSLPSFG
ncbi:IS110 family transposase [Solitalea lacus]|uniref:IS110 family transposase n=1 Tax=Solitalea lacus TaxID=2911172 RepID=UPI001EDB3324|nr:IS110 family transposase [Solitalea lacus]UKJ09122.1 IS110 family transposase [Solitalea lacus]